MINNKNDLRGLNDNGFKKSDQYFIDEFKNHKKIELLRIEIRKYFVKTNTANKFHSSYGLKHILEKHIGEYVSNGELIYAMHLEGFKIYRQDINCLFNVRETSIRQLKNSKEILSRLNNQLNGKIADYFKNTKRSYKYKYYFDFLIKQKFTNQSFSKLDVLSIIAKEISETIETVKSWNNILANDEKEIPIDKLEILSRIFNVLPEELENRIINTYKA